MSEQGIFTCVKVESYSEPGWHRSEQLYTFSNGTVVVKFCADNQKAWNWLFFETEAMASRKTMQQVVLGFVNNGCREQLPVHI